MSDKPTVFKISVNEGHLLLIGAAYKAGQEDARAGRCETSVVAIGQRILAVVQSLNNHPHRPASGVKGD